MSRYKNPVAYTGRKANSSHTGQARFATEAEATAASKDDVIISPATLDAVSDATFAAPPAIGSTTPAAATFTDVEATGDISISGAGKQLQVEGGTVCDFIGQATLVLGTATILHTGIATTDRIFLQRRGANASTALGELNVSAVTAATSFVITSQDLVTPANTETGDLSTVDYFIVRQL